MQNLRNTGRTKMVHTKRYGTFNMQIQTAYQRTVPVPLQKTRTVRAYRTLQQKFRRTIPYCHP